MTLILGINAFHADAAACLVRDGHVVAAVAEERLGERRKHYAGFPAQAIRAVLDIAGVGIGDVGYVALGHDKRANLGAKASYALHNPLRTARKALNFLARQREIASLAERIAEECGFPLADCRFETVEVEHHVAHAASAFFGSPFEEAAAFTYDASGDFVSTLYAGCRGTSLDVLERVYLPDSLGYFYTAVCQFIGFDHFGEEYKVMGLAAYGEPRYLDTMRRMVQPAGGGKFRLDPKYFAGVGEKSHEELLDEAGQIVIPPLFSKALEEELGAPRRRADPLGQRERDLAASCQAHFEEVALHALRWLHGQFPSDNLVMAGGCALNGVCNARILRDTPFRRQYIHCAAGDDGTAVGAALHAWNVVLAGERSPALWNAYLGPEHPEADIRAALAEAGLAGERYERDELLRVVAGHLAEGRVAGWYQGRSEWGPRALGNRSILAHPGWPGMKDIINHKIKRRESFRPFAPSVLADRVGEYFEQDVESPFMMHVVKIREEKRHELTAVTHEDGTGRLQTVSREQNALYYDLIETFSRLTGTPVILNTSFNENEPIVDTPRQAVACFERNDIDLLVLGNYVVLKERGARAAEAGEGAVAAGRSA
jgi:carbamoyltransferase